MTKPDRKRPEPPARLYDTERGDWFFDELMTPQPDAAQAYYRARLKAMTQEPERDPE